jgi:hypothetical protein
VAFDYTDSHGDQQQTPEYDAHVMILDAPVSSPPAAAGGPSNSAPTVSPAATVPPATAPPTGASRTS